MGASKSPKNGLRNCVEYISELSQLVAWNQGGGIYLTPHPSLIDSHFWDINFLSLQLALCTQNCRKPGGCPGFSTSDAVDSMTQGDVSTAPTTLPNKPERHGSSEGTKVCGTEGKG